MANEKRMEILIDDKVAEGNYVNSGNIMYNQAEFIIDFTRMVPPPGKARVLSRVIMTPMQAKNFLSAVEKNIENYEKQFGAIPSAKNQEKKVGFNQ